MAVIGFEIKSRRPYSNGKTFDRTGSYEHLEGKVTFAVDPLHPANDGIVDLNLAPLDGEGKVRFISDMSLLVPLDITRGNGNLLIDIPNRGGRLIPASFNRVLTLTPEDRLKPGDGFLFRCGYTLGSIGWQFDAFGEGSLTLAAPEARVDNQPIRGPVMMEFRPDSDTDALPLLQPGQEQLSYPVLNTRADTHRLYIKHYEDGPSEEIPSSQWCFAGTSGSRSVPSDTHICLTGGLEKGRIYQLVYTTEGAPVVGTGLLAIREIATFLRNKDPLSPLPSGFKRVYGFGVSQTGRALRHFLYEGLNRDEEKRIAYDGLFIHLAGGQRGDFNHRFAQPSVAFTPSFGQRFPFAQQLTEEPFCGKKDGLLKKLEEIDAVPNIIMVNTSWEYWRGDASLAHTTPDSSSDLVEHPKVRIYLIAGTHHIGGILIRGKQLTQLPLGGGVTHGFNVVNSAPISRAALVNLDLWVRTGLQPPESRYPKLADGTAASRADVLQSFGRIKQVHRIDPTRLSRLRRMDLGPDEARGLGVLPASVYEEYPCLVSALDEDFNEIAGIRLPDIRVPIGSHTGWNPRAAESGSPDLAALFAGFTLFFCRGREEREASEDPRLSIEERYRDKNDYLDRVGEVTKELIAARYLLDEDRDWVISSCAARYDAAIAGR